jgi:hypothetical protein
MRPCSEHFVEDNAEGYKSRRRSLKLWFSPMGKGDAKAGGFLAPKVSACGGRACRLIGRQPEGVLRASGAAAAAAAARAPHCCTRVSPAVPAATAGGRLP